MKVLEELEGKVGKILEVSKLQKGTITPRHEETKGGGGTNRAQE